MKYKCVGVDSEKDFCECCGKSGLKRVVWIKDLESGEVKHYGTTCALSPEKGFGLEYQIDLAIKTANLAKANEKRKAKIETANVQSILCKNAIRALYVSRGGRFQTGFNLFGGVVTIASNKELMHRCIDDCGGDFK